MNQKYALEPLMSIQVSSSEIIVLLAAVQHYIDCTQHGSHVYKEAAPIIGRFRERLDRKSVV